jgi:DNA-binding PadR family transcriptional regulator
MTVKMSDLILWVFKRNIDGVLRNSEIEREVMLYIMVFDPENNHNTRSKVQRALKQRVKDNTLNKIEELRKVSYSLTASGKEEIKDRFKNNEFNSAYCNYIGAYTPNCSYDKFKERVIKHFINEHETEMHRVYDDYKNLYTANLQFKKRWEEIKRKTQSNPPK